MTPPSVPAPSGAGGATTLPNPGNPPTPQAAAATAVLVELPRALAAARAVLLEAVVQSRNPNGTTTLKTESGTVVVKTGQPLALGAALTIDITRVGDQLTARLQPQANPRSGTGSEASRGPPTVAPQPAAPPTDSVATGASKPARFTAVALSPEHAAGAPATAAAPATTGPRPAGTTSASDAATRSAPSGPPTSPSGAPSAATGPPAAATAATSTATASASSAPTPTPQAAAGNVQGERPANAAPTGTSGAPTAANSDARAGAANGAVAPGQRPAVPTAPSPTLNGAAPGGPPTAAAPPRPSVPMPMLSSALGATSLPPGTTVEMRLAAPASAPTSAARPGEPARPLPLAAIVVGVLPQGRVIIDTPIGRLVAALPPELSAALGESIALEWFPETLHAPGGNPRRQPAQPGHARGWESARDVAGALLESGDAGLRAAGERLVPRPGARLAEQLMLFIGKGDGDIARWLGETTRRQLEAARQGELLARSENATAREPDRGEASEWRHVTVPLFDGQQLRPIDIHARRRRMNDRGRPRDQSRFIVECQHDDFGAIQIDGLLTAGDGRRRLDIILRTHAEIPAEDRAAIDALFADACGAIGMQGELVFQAVARFPDMLHDAAALHRSVVA